MAVQKPNRGHRRRGVMVVLINRTALKKSADGFHRFFHVLGHVFCIDLWDPPTAARGREEQTPGRRRRLRGSRLLLSRHWRFFDRVVEAPELQHFGGGIDGVGLRRRVAECKHFRRGRLHRLAILLSEACRGRPIVRPYARLLGSALYPTAPAARESVVKGPQIRRDRADCSPSSTTTAPPSSAACMQASSKRISRPTQRTRH